MKWAVLILSAAASVGAHYLDSSEVSQEEWDNYKLLHNKQYSSAEEERQRMKTYAANKVLVDQHNEQYGQGLTSFTLGLNQFSDRFPEELEQEGVLSSIKSNRGIEVHEVEEIMQDSNVIGPASIPNEVDWRRRGAVTRVKNQGDCDSGWAFATIGALEGYHAIERGFSVSMSEQNLIDCCGNNGCGFHNPKRAFGYVINHGIETEKTYPYNGKMGQCRFESKFAITGINSFIEVAPSNETILKKAVALRGPIAAGISIYPEDTQFRAYQGGVYWMNRKKCSSSDKHTHYVLIVGYGTERVQTRNSEEDVDYWLIKNSWGTGWGINGYMKLARNRGNQCCIASSAHYPYRK